MFKSHIDRKIEWVEGHLPPIAALPPAEVCHIVEEAMGLTKVLRITIGIIGSIVGAAGGLILAPYYLERPYPKLEHLSIALGAAFAATYLASLIGEHVLNRKIELLGLGPQ